MFLLHEEGQEVLFSLFIGDAEQRLREEQERGTTQGGLLDPLVPPSECAEAKPSVLANAIIRAANRLPDKRPAEHFAARHASTDVNKALVNALRESARALL